MHSATITLSPLTPIFKNAKILTLNIRHQKNKFLIIDYLNTARNNKDKKNLVAMEIMPVLPIIPLHYGNILQPQGNLIQH